MNIETILLNLAVRFESFYHKWMTDDEPFDASWMNVEKWKGTHAAR